MREPRLDEPAQVGPLEARVERPRALVQRRRGLVLLPRVEQHRQAAHARRVAWVRPQLVHRTADDRARARAGTGRAGWRAAGPAHARRRRSPGRSRGPPRRATGSWFEDTRAEGRRSERERRGGRHGRFEGRGPWTCATWMPVRRTAGSDRSRCRRCVLVSGGFVFRRTRQAFRVFVSRTGTAARSGSGVRRCRSPARCRCRGRRCRRS